MYESYGTYVNAEYVDNHDYVGDTGDRTDDDTDDDTGDDADDDTDDDNDHLREFLKTSGALPVTGGRGGHYFGHGSASSVPLKPLFLKRLGDTGLPFSSERHRNRRYLTFS